MVKIYEWEIILNRPIFWPKPSPPKFNCLQKKNNNNLQKTCVQNSCRSPLRFDMQPIPQKVSHLHVVKHKDVKIQCFADDAKQTTGNYEP